VRTGGQQARELLLARVQVGERVEGDRDEVEALLEREGAHVARHEPDRRPYGLRLLRERRARVGQERLGAIEADDAEVSPVASSPAAASGSVRRPVPQPISSIRRGACRCTSPCQNGRSKWGSSAFSSS
jgi:hypothetical protein